MAVIEGVYARKILDSRGNATVEVDVVTEVGFGRAAAPSGASTGAHEVQAWPEGGVDAALAAVEEHVEPAFKDWDPFLQRELDELLEDTDGTANFARIGGNTAVAVSLATARAAAQAQGVPLYAYLGGAFVSRLPRPFGNVLGGGAHAVGGTDIQEYMAVALGSSFEESAFANAWAHRRVRDLLKKRLPDAAIGKGDEGAWVAPLSNVDAMKVVAEACDAAKDEFGFEVRPALDVAATELYDGEVYNYRDGKKTPEEQVEFMVRLVDDFGLYSVEDPFAEDDWASWKAFTREVGDRCLVVGDDLFTTNPDRVLRGINEKAANAVLVKPNQIGTLTRTVETIHLAHENGFRTVMSHRSGETTDDAIAHLAAAFGSMGIKTGAVGGERIAKLNELIRIEEEL